jgi:hypothetical protein
MRDMNRFRKILEAIKGFTNRSFHARREYREGVAVRRPSDGELEGPTEIVHPLVELIVL